MLDETGSISSWKTGGLIVHGLTSQPTQYRLYGLRATVFTGQKTQPTVSKY